MPSRTLSGRGARTTVLAAAVTLLASTACATADPAPSPAGAATADRPPATTPAGMVVRDDLRTVFTDAGVGGTFALLDTAGGRLVVVDRDRATTRAVPASTFKVAHSLIALETGAVRDVDESIPWDGTPQPFPEWQRDMSIRQAVPGSNAAVFRQLARRIGPQREQEWLDRLGYGNREVGPVVDRFWLDGPLRISPVEQTEFLRRLAARELPVRREVQDAVVDVLRLERGPAGELFGKTGWQFDATPQLGWWVGWVRCADGRMFTFALVMDLRGAADAPLRQSIGRDLLTRLGALPVS